MFLLNIELKDWTRSKDSGICEGKIHYVACLEGHESFFVIGFVEFSHRCHLY